MLMHSPSRREFLAASSALLASGTADLSAAKAEKDPLGIWGQVILPQPHDKAPFHAIKVPGWVSDTTGVGYTLSVMNSQDRKAAAELGATLSEIGFVDPFFAYYDSKLLKRRSPHVAPERLEKDLAEYAKLKVRVLGVYPPTLQCEVYELHPDWRHVSTDTDEVPNVDLKKSPHGGMLCLLGPYGDFFIDVLAEIVTQFPVVSAFSFDGLHHAGGCYCKHCRMNYKSDTGKVIPKRNMESEAYRSYLHWADRKLEEVIRGTQTRLKRIKPDVALVTWTTNAGRFGHFLDIPRNMSARMNLLLDAPDQEFWMDETNRGSSVVPAFGAAYVWAVSNHRTAFAEPYLMSRGNPYGKDSFPAHEVERRVMLALTHGAGPSIAYSQPEHLKAGVAQAMREVKRRKPWLSEKRPEPWAAILMSDNTRVFYGRSSGQVEDRYLSHVFGWFRAALELHLPVTLVNDWNLVPDDLSRFKVLVLPNAASVDDRQADAVRKFVNNGGGLIASLDASLCDEFGTPRPRLALGDVLGVEHRGVAATVAGKEKLDENFTRTLPADYWLKRKGVWEFKRIAGLNSFLESQKLSELIGRAAVTFKGPLSRIELCPGSKVVATVRAKGDSKSDDPAIVTNVYGKGRVVYFAAGIDAAYYLNSYPYHRFILGQAIEWAANSLPPVMVSAPMCVHAVTVRQSKEGERLIVHLFNDVNTTGGHGLPAEEVPLREEVLPIHDIRVVFRGYPIRSICLEPDHLELEMRRGESQVEVNVPKLSIHAMVVAELG
jgi:hypothetical protein